MKKKELNQNSIISLDRELQFNFNQEKRQLTHYVSTENVNCYGYILRNAGMNDEEYRLNPVMLWAHELSGGFFERTPKPSELIIAKNISLKADDKGVESVTEFADTDLGNEIMNFNASGFLNAWSVRWDTLNDDSDISIVNEVPIVLNWKVKEISSCVMPGNPYATNKLQMALSEARTPLMKGYLHNQLMTAKFSEELEQFRLTFENKLKEVGNSDNSLSPESLKNLKNEILADFGRFKKDTTDKFMKLAFDNLTLKGNLHSEILTSISNSLDVRIEKVIRKYLGKVD
jgi:hypothetical protein